MSAEIDMAGGLSGWNAWIIAQQGRSISATFAETFFRFLAFQKPDPNYDLKSFNLDSDPAKLAAIGSILDAKNPDLSASRREEARSSCISAGLIRLSIL